MANNVENDENEGRNIGNKERTWKTAVIDRG